jgi:hypothetical protein
MRDDPVPSDPDTASDTLSGMDGLWTSRARRAR